MCKTLATLTALVLLIWAPAAAAQDSHEEQAADPHENLTPGVGDIRLP